MPSFQDATPSPVTPIDFSRPADEVAPRLIGAVIYRAGVGIRLTEVEAYLGEADPASHAFIGETSRNSTMFGPPQHLYVYASYGVHRAGNLVCSPDGVAGGVLLRAGEVVIGADVARARRTAQQYSKDGRPRKTPKPPTEAGLARGPGNLGRALGLDLTVNGSAVVQVSSLPESLTSSDDAEQVLLQQGSPTRSVRGPRIGISKNVEAPLRFWVPGDPTVTTPHSAPRT